MAQGKEAGGEEGRLQMAGGGWVRGRWEGWGKGQLGGTLEQGLGKGPAGSRVRGPLSYLHTPPCPLLWGSPGGDHKDLNSSCPE